MELKNVKKQYKLSEGNYVKALKGINLKINEGEFVTIFGPSGCGKSTLMHIMGLLDKPTEGTVYINSQDTKELNSNGLTALRSQTIGFVFQSFFLTPNLTALENVEFPMVLNNQNEHERVKRAKELLKKMELSERANHLPFQLSGGQKQRVAIARALANNPKILLADEPTGNLDSKTGEEVIKLFKELWRQGTTLVVITHDSNLASQAPRTIHMMDGEMVKDEKNYAHIKELIKETKKIDAHHKAFDVKNKGGEMQR
ncbi:putative ABC transporter ATP-binding protein [Candidatus Tiddalikarchaeum anstoanum]|nr:putative ABC transporter ATP-binding protein [Candidatus Tiddalikarchaeum anstoanum]